MTDTPPTTSSPGSTPPSSAAEQARIRRERREAKIKAGGTSRLNKITGLGGGLQRDNEHTITTSEVASISHGDPEEVDISKNFYQPTRNYHSRNGSPNPNRPSAELPSGFSQIDDQALRAMMLELTPPSESPKSNQLDRPGDLFAPVHNSDSAFDPGANDPMMAMLQQMLRGAGGESGTIQPFPGLPPVGFPDQNLNEVATTTDTLDYIWRLVHAAFAFGFGLYIASTAGFIGTMQARDESAFTGADLRAFYTFATVEAMLQGTRLIFDRRQANHQGFFGMILRLLPNPFREYLMIFMNYRTIWTTTSADVLVLVFVLVAANHWKVSCRPNM